MFGSIGHFIVSYIGSKLFATVTILAPMYIFLILVTLTGVVNLLVFKFRENRINITS